MLLFFYLHTDCQNCVVNKPIDKQQHEHYLPPHHNFLNNGTVGLPKGVRVYFTTVIVTLQENMLNSNMHKATVLYLIILAYRRGLTPMYQDFYTPVLLIPRNSQAWSCDQDQLTLRMCANTSQTRNQMKRYCLRFFFFEILFTNLFVSNFLGPSSSAY